MTKPSAGVKVKPMLKRLIANGDGSFTWGDEILTVNRREQGFSLGCTYITYDTWDALRRVLGEIP